MDHALARWGRSFSSCSGMPSSLGLHVFRRLSWKRASRGGFSGCGQEYLPGAWTFFFLFYFFDEIGEDVGQRDFGHMGVFPVYQLQHTVRRHHQYRDTENVGLVV